MAWKGTEGAVAEWVQPGRPLNPLDLAGGLPGEFQIVRRLEAQPALGCPPKACPSRTARSGVIRSRPSHRAPRQSTLTLRWSAAAAIERSNGSKHRTSTVLPGCRGLSIGSAQAARSMRLMLQAVLRAWARSWADCIASQVSAPPPKA